MALVDKEITPIEYGEKEGYYYYFHENGQIAVQGEYHWGERVNDDRKLLQRKAEENYHLPLGTFRKRCPSLRAQKVGREREGDLFEVSGGI